MSEYTITPSCDCWKDVSDLIGKGIPNAIVSCLGRNFGAYYYKKLAMAEHSCVFVSQTKDKELIGVIIGTTNRNRGDAFGIADKLKLLYLANFRLLSPAFIKWAIKGIISKIFKAQKQLYLLDAELLDIAINERYRGCGIAPELIRRMEGFFTDRQVNKYLILTEKSNLRANGFYKKIGAVYVRTYKFHGREINEYHKEISK
jgi:ribosomal protein S18 acetylase RimI-like enzyme